MKREITLDQVNIPGEAHIYMEVLGNGFVAIGADCAVRGREQIGFVIECNTGWHDFEPSTEVLDYIASRVEEEYSPIARQAVAAYNSGDRTRFRSLSREAKSILQQIAKATSGKINK